MYVVRENKSLINAKKSFVTSMSVIKQEKKTKETERQQQKKKRRKKRTI